MSRQPSGVRPDSRASDAFAGHALLAFDGKEHHSDAVFAG
jgi:hypothetical protein